MCERSLKTSPRVMMLEEAVSWAEAENFDSRAKGLREKWTLKDRGSANVTRVWIDLGREILVLLGWKCYSLESSLSACTSNGMKHSIGQLTFCQNRRKNTCSKYSEKPKCGGEIGFKRLTMYWAIGYQGFNNITRHSSVLGYKILC